MLVRNLAFAIGVLLVCASAALANETAAADPFAPLQQGYEDLPFNNGHAVPASYPASYPATPTHLPPSHNALAVPNASLPDPTITPPAVDLAAYWGAPVVGPPCPCDSVYRTSAWRISTEIIPMQSHLTRAQFGAWPDDGALALRFNLGYENVEGYGVRGRLWGFGQNAEASAEDVDLAAVTFNLDFYKRLFIEDTELVLGAGPTSSALVFELSDHDESRFAGGGLGVFAEVWHPLVRFEKTDLGTVGRGRLSLLTGEWEDDTGFVIAETDHDNLTIIELAWGLEMRRRFGKLEDKYWSLAVLVEHQNWDSAWMTSLAGTSVGFTGTNVNLGLAW